VGPPEENTAEAGGETSTAAENTPGSQQTASSSEGSGATDSEPTFSEQGVGNEGLPDLRDNEPSLEDTSGGMAGTPGGAGPMSSGAGSESGAGQSGAGSPAGSQTAGSGGGVYGSGSENSYGSPAGMPTGTSRGPLTPAEQVAILDAQLEKGAGEFDALILKTEAEQREAARTAAKQSSRSGGGISAGISTGSSEEGDSPYDEGMASAGGGYSTGGGLGGAGGGTPPQDTAKYPAPADIPSGSDDDVVARQLREAASREADPAVREKLWAEYRKYKGIQ
jgi:hypothetical protein